MLSLKYLSKFWKTLKMPLINCEVNLILTWSKDGVIVYTNVANQGATFPINDTKPYVPLVTSSTQKCKIPQLQSCVERKINWKKYLPKFEVLAQNPDLNYLVESSFQGIKRPFELTFEKDTQRISNKRYYLPNVETKYNNVMIDGKSFFDKPIKNNKITYENTRKMATCQGDDYTTGCLLDYTYHRDINKMIVIDLSKQQALDSGRKAIQQINFTANLDRAGDTRIFFILEEAKETALYFLQGTVKVL